MPQASTIPVIFTGSPEDDHMMAKGFEMGAADFIIEPYTVNELVARINRLLSKSG